MNKCIFSLILTFAIINSAWSGIDGGGGVGVSCNNNGIITFELLDIHEARLKGYSFSSFPQSQKEAIQLLGELVSNHFWNPDTIPLEEMIRQNIKHFIKPIFEKAPSIDLAQYGKIKIVFQKKPLSLSRDIGAYNIKPNCKLEQVAYLNDQKKILTIVEENWNKLNWLDRAALVGHELLYLVDRTESIQNVAVSSQSINSVRSRKFIGQLFSDAGVVSKSNGLPGIKKLYTCYEELEDDERMIYGYFYQNKNDVSFVFNIIHGKGSLYQLTANFSKIIVSDLLENSQANFSEITFLEFEGQKEMPMFLIRLTRQGSDYPWLQTFLKKDGKFIPVEVNQQIYCEKL